MPINPEAVVISLLGIAAGVYWFITGFCELKAKRTIQNIPTSRISTGAVGTNVEIKGRILNATEALLKTPIGGDSCVFYSVEIQKRVQSRDHSYWKKIDQFFSSDYFFVDDDSGALAQVFVEKASFRRQGRTKELQTGSGNFSRMPVPLIMALHDNEANLRSFKLKQVSGLFSQKYRFVEWCFQPRESVYVLGYAESGVKPPVRRKLKFKDFLAARKMLEKDPRLQTRFDRNKDGALDQEELEMGAAAVGLQLQTEPAKAPAPAPELEAKMIFKERPGFPFLISNMKESDLVKKISWTAALKVCGGPMAAIAGTVYLFLLSGAGF